MALQNLELITGHSHEGIKLNLDQMSIKYKIEEEPRYRPQRNFFRSSLIYIPTSKKTETLSLLGTPNHSMGSNGEGAVKNESVSYHCIYGIKPGFDFSKLNGKVTFSRGRLVETTIIDFTEEF